ncbi:MAG: hypothetical protein Q9208_002910 [Pyrenodesmia sp. 3 TL-2023]
MTTPTHLPFLLVLNLVTLSLQVDITLSWWSEGMSYFDHLITAHFRSVPPGTCCKPSPQQLPSLRDHRAGETIFHHLLHNQFGAGWAATGAANIDIVHCTGAPILRVFGPGTAEDDSIVVYNPPWGEDVEGTPRNVAFAASWVDLRVRFPPDGHGSRYLAWQGLRGAVWGRGTWSAASDGVPFPKMRRRRRRERLVLDGQAMMNGTAYVAAPVRWAVPDAYTVNGNEYRLVGNDTYMDERGGVLEFRMMGA